MHCNALYLGILGFWRFLWLRHLAWKCLSGSLKGGGQGRGAGGQHGQQAGPGEGGGQGAQARPLGRTGGRAQGRHGLREAVREQRRPEAAHTRRRESSNGWVIEARQPGERAIGGGRLEDVGCQHRVPAGPGHLLPLVLHPPVLEPNLEKD